MDGDQPIGDHTENAILETPQSGSPRAMTAITSDVQGNLQSLAKQASRPPDQLDGVKDQNQDDTSLDPSTVPMTVPTSHTSDPQAVESDYKAVASTLPGNISPLFVLSKDVSRELDMDRFADVVEEQFQHEYAPDWPASQISDGSYGTSHQYPPGSIAESDDNRIQAFAKLEFDDGEFYMNTYAVELGRDLQAAREAEERDLEARSQSDYRSKKRSISRGGSVRSDKVKKENVQNPTDVFVSGSGGVIADYQNAGSGKKVKRKKSKSWSSSSRQLSRKSSTQFNDPKTDYNALAMASLTDSSPGFYGTGTGRQMPPHDLTPLIPIHPPAILESPLTSYKSISRKHIRIAFNFDEHLFQAEIMGLNGGFVDEEFYDRGATVTLVNGSMIQIGGVRICFVLPDVPPGETGAERALGSEPLSGGMMSFDMADSSREESQEESSESEEECDTPDAIQEEEEPEISRTRGKGKKKSEAPPPAPPKRKGPGRPPKNGIISKREQALQAKQAKEDAKAKAEGKSLAPTGQGKVKNGKDAKGAKREESTVQPNGKRKYTKRKRAGGTEDQQAIRESTEHTEPVPPDQERVATVPPKPAKEKKPAKPPRSPSPVFDESQMTPEQLAKPQSSYVILIHEALSNSTAGQMSLPQIYRAIERRYPFYKLRVQTQGWQSSVRHNLSQHPAFCKIERDGKGWMWGLVPEIPINKEKKRRATPPPVSQQHYYPPNPMMQHPYPYPSMPPPNGHLPPAPYGSYPGMPPGRIPYPPPPRSGFPLPLVNAQSESTYRSPYQSTPPPAPNQSASQPQQASTTNGSNGHYPTALSQPPVQSSNNQPTPGNIASPSSHLPPASGASSHGNHEQDVNQAVSKFKDALINNIDDKVRGETLVTSAINRVLGIQAKSTLPGGVEDPNEKTIMDTFSRMLGDLSKKNMQAKNQTFQPNPLVTLTETSALNLEAPTATAIAAEKAAKLALTSGDGAPPAVHENGEAQGLNGATKRGLEIENGTNGNDAGQPEAKRVASGTLES